VRSGRSFCDRQGAAISSFVVSSVRAVLACVAGLSLAACSLLTSLDGLEGPGDGGVADSGGGGGFDATSSYATPLDDSATVNDSMTSPLDSGACTADVQTDPGNCGVCGHDCLGGSCASGACQPLTLAIAHGSIGLAIDSTFVYWADNEAGAINKVSTALTHLGTPTAVVSGTHAQNVQGIATDGTYVYWTNKT